MGLRLGLPWTKLLINEGFMLHIYINVCLTALEVQRDLEVAVNDT